MAFNPFVGKSQTWLETELEKAQSDLASGASTISGGEGTVQFGKMLHQSPQVRIEQLLRALYALDPDTYPLSSITRATRSVGVISRSY